MRLFIFRNDAEGHRAGGHSGTVALSLRGDVQDTHQER